MKNTFQFITAVHGNEYLPTLALAAMGQSQVVGNPRALARGVRYTERDLNASFGTGGTTYEEVRASELEKIIKQDVDVIDLHTFSCESEPFAIIVDLQMLPVAQNVGVRNVVYMKHNIKAGHALINAFPGVSVEVGAHNDSRSYKKAQDIVRSVKLGKTLSVHIYEVYDRIEEKGDYVNFKESNGFVPVLYGERAYDGQGFYGLKAREITGTILKEEI